MEPVQIILAEGRHRMGTLPAPATSDPAALAAARTALTDGALLVPCEHGRPWVLDPVDLLGVGPVWPTATKGATVGIGLRAVADLAARARAAGLVTGAIGGIDAARAAGVDGVCVVSAVCSAPDPAARALLPVGAEAAP